MLQRNLVISNNIDNVDSRIKGLSNLVLMDISKFLTHKLYNVLAKLLKAANEDYNLVPHLTHASDILSLIILQKYGGIYHYCDYEIFKG